MFSNSGYGTSFEFAENTTAEARVDLSKQRGEVAFGCIIVIIMALIIASDCNILYE